jgi:electron transport complex protein RnfG
VKNKNNLLRDAIALFLITLISGLALSYVYEITKTPIAVQAEQKALKANQAVFQEAASFEEDEQLSAQIGTADLVSLSSDYSGVTIESISRAYSSNAEFLGYNITVSTSSGYKDGIKFVFGYSLDGSISGIEFLAINETAGLGMKAKEPGFLNQFLNKQVEQFAVVKTGATSEDQVDAISGATITSAAIANAVNAGIAFAKEFSTELGGGQ